MTDEKWAVIKDFPQYEVSTHGRIRSIDRLAKVRANGVRKISGMILRTKINTKRGGYEYITLSKNSVHYSRKVHRLVAEAFIPNPRNKPEVNHINNNRTDNRVENLEWVTSKENNLWKIQSGTSANKHKKAVKAVNITTGSEMIFESTLDAEAYGFDRAAIWRCMRGEYRHHHGYRFEYV